MSQFKTWSVLVIAQVRAAGPVEASALVKARLEQAARDFPLERGEVLSIGDSAIPVQESERRLPSPSDLIERGDGSRGHVTAAMFEGEALRVRIDEGAWESVTGMRVLDEPEPAGASSGLPYCQQCQAFYVPGQHEHAGADS